MSYSAALPSWKLWSWSNICKHLFLFSHQTRTSYQQNMFLLSMNWLGFIPRDVLKEVIIGIHSMISFTTSLSIKFLIIPFKNIPLTSPPASKLWFQHGNNKWKHDYLLGFHLHAWLLLPEGINSSGCTGVTGLIITDISLSLLIMSTNASSENQSYCWLIEWKF